jgi:hypothetical protein
VIVIGRDESGQWIAIHLGAGNLTGWVLASTVEGLPDIEGMDVASRTPVETPAVDSVPAR